MRQQMLEIHALATAALALPNAEEAHAALWAHGDVPFSPPDADGFVAIRDVETILVPKYGAEIKFTEVTTTGTVEKRVVVPRRFRFQEMRNLVPVGPLFEQVGMDIDSAAMRGNAAHEYREPTMWERLSGQKWAIKTEVAGALASNESLANLYPKLAARCEWNARGMFGHFRQLRYNETEGL